MWTRIKNFFLKLVLPTSKLLYPLSDKVAIIVGHSRLADGAVAFDGTTEYNYNSNVAKKLTELLGDKIVVFTKDYMGYSRILELCQEYHIGTSIELHFNAANKSAQGCECLVMSYTKLDIPRQLLSKISMQYGMNNRGIKVLDSGIRGYNNLRSMMPLNSMIIEPFFGDNESCAMILQDVDGYATIIADVLFPGRIKS